MGAFPKKQDSQHHGRLQQHTHQVRCPYLAVGDLGAIAVGGQLDVTNVEHRGGKLEDHVLLLTREAELHHRVQHLSERRHKGDELVIVARTLPGQ